MYGESTRVERPMTCAPCVIEVFMAGDVEHAKQVVRRFCKDRPSCVTVTPTSYIYTGGEEAGFVVSFRAYPRFPAGAAELTLKATELATRLVAELAQDSYMIVTPTDSMWVTTREVK